MWEKRNWRRNAIKNINVCERTLGREIWLDGGNTHGEVKGMDA